MRNTSPLACVASGLRRSSAGHNRGFMPRRVKDFIQISEYTSLDALIRYLETIRDTLPADAEPELTMRGDDVFGRRLSISFMRELTAEEAELDARYTGHADPEADANIEQLRRKLEDVPYETEAKKKSTRK